MRELRRAGVHPEHLRRALTACARNTLTEPGRTYAYLRMKYGTNHPMFVYGDKIRDKDGGPVLTVVRHDPNIRIVVVEDNSTHVTHWFDWYFERVE